MTEIVNRCCENKKNVKVHSLLGFNWSEKTLRWNEKVLKVKKLCFPILISQQPRVDKTVNIITNTTINNGLIKGFFLFMFLFPSMGWAQKQNKVSSFDLSHSTLTQVLQKHVVVRGPVSQVNYKALKKDPSQLNAYLKKLDKVKKRELQSWTKQQQYVFWVNAYNAYTLKLIVDNYPVKSIRDLGSFLKSPWKKKFFTLLGQKRSLDEVEHKILRVQFNEPRTHFAVNCASIGCPALLNEAFTADKLELQLEKQTRAFLRDRSRNKIDGRRLIISKIFDWFKKDFTKNGQTVQKFVARYIAGDPSVKAKLNQGKFKVRYSSYDWNLNVFNGPGKLPQAGTFPDN